MVILDFGASSVSKLFFYLEAVCVGWLYAGIPVCDLVAELFDSLFHF